MDIKEQVKNTRSIIYKDLHLRIEMMINQIEDNEMFDDQQVIGRRFTWNTDGSWNIEFQYVYLSKPSKVLTYYPTGGDPIEDLETELDSRGI